MTTKQFKHTTAGQPSAVFLISLKSESENRANVFHELKKLKTGPLQVLTAFDGVAKLPFTSERLSPYRGTIGCLISHLKIYLHCHREGIERALIFEDDAQVVNPNLANHEIKKGETSNANICCYCAQSTNDHFLNCHAYSMSLIAMQACLASLDSILQWPLNIHIDRLIEFCRRRYKLSYRSLPRSSIIQDKTRPFTIQWGEPDFVAPEELQTVKQALLSTATQLTRFHPLDQRVG